VWSVFSSADDNEPVNLFEPEGERPVVHPEAATGASRVA
jgi:hypothetical protein